MRGDSQRSTELLNKAVFVFAVAFTLGAPALAKPDEVKPTESKTSTIKSSAKTPADKQKVRELIKNNCSEAVNTQYRNKQQALDLSQKSYDLAAQNFGKESPEMVWPEFALGHVLGNNRDAKGAQPHFEHAYNLATKYPNNPCMRAKDIEVWLWKAYLRNGNRAKAIALVEGTINDFVKAKDIEKLQDYAIVYMRSRDCDQADALIRRTVACCGNDNRKLIKVLQTQIMILLRCRRFKDAIPVVERRKELLRLRDDQTAYADTVRELGQLCDQAERYEQSSKYYKEALHLFRAQKRDKYDVAKVMLDLSRVQRNLGRTAEADALKKGAEDLKFGTLKD